MFPVSDRALVIEDDKSIHPVLESIASELGIVAEITVSGKSGITLSNTNAYKFVLLDLDLPDIDGVEVAHRLRRDHPQLPIIILTGRSDEPSRILGLELGADDYVCKPFSLPELTARVRAVLRRSENFAKLREFDPAPKTIGDLTLDATRREFSRAGVPIELSKTEFDVLEYLFTRPGVAVSREELIEQVWGYQCSGFEGTVTAYFSRIRLKIEHDAENPQYIRTIRGVGYRFVDAKEIDSSGRLIRS